MTTIPSGNPLFLRSSGITQYGGDANKKDYGGIGSINARTDLSAAQFLRLTADLAAVARVTALLRMLILPSATAPYAAVTLCVPAWAVPVSYPNGSLPPSSIYPVVTASGATDFSVSLPLTAADDYGIGCQLSPRIVAATGGSWDGAISNNTFSITGTTAGKPVSVIVW